MKHLLLERSCGDETRYQTEKMDESQMQTQNFAHIHELVMKNIFP